DVCSSDLDSVEHLFFLEDHGSRELRRRIGMWSCESMVIELVVGDRFMKEREVECDTRVVGDEHRALFEEELYVNFALHDDSNSSVAKMRAELLHVWMQAEDRC